MDDKVKQIKKSSKNLIIQIVLILVGILGTTYATTYILNSVNITISTSNINVVYAGSLTLPGSSITLTPINDSTVSSNSSNVIRVNFTVKGASTNPDIPIIYDVALEDLIIPKALRSQYVKWQLYKNSTLLSSGNFSPQFDNIVDGRLVLTEIQQDLPTNSSTADSYQFVLWISESCPSQINCTIDQDQSGMLGKTIAGKITVETYTKNKKALVRRPTEDKQPNAPQLVDGMIPIYYDSTNNVWKKADKDNPDNQWYDYDSARWANVAIVGDASSISNSTTIRNNYKNAAVGQTVAESDILAYYVWIPRFKYRVWNMNKVIGVDTYNAEGTGIDITWETGTATTGTVKCTTNSTSRLETCSLTSGSNNSFYTHPAFTLGTKQLKGIWFGKFETSGTEYIPKIKPNVAPLKNQTTFEAYKTNQKFGTENYYLEASSSNYVESHMSRNMEWAAALYLSNSIYGKCLVNCTSLPVASSNYTGLGSYNTSLTYSTTSNITGVYDLSSVSGERVMAVMYTDNDSDIAYSSSGFGSGTLLPSSAYVDLYAYGTSYSDQTAMNRTKLGDGIGEVIKTSGVLWSTASTWDSGGSFMLYASGTTPVTYNSWLYRGMVTSSAIDGTTAGTYSVFSGQGVANDNASSRSVLTFRN